MEDYAPKKVPKRGAGFVEKVEAIALQDNKSAFLQQLSAQFTFHSTPQYLEIVKSTSFIGKLAEALKENKHWATEEPQWILGVIDSIYSCKRWEIPIDQTKQLLDVAQEYLSRIPSEFALHIIRFIATPPYYKKLLYGTASQHAVYGIQRIPITVFFFYCKDILKRVIFENKKLYSTAIKCLQEVVSYNYDWQMRVMQDASFIQHLLANQNGVVWVFMSSLAQHLDSKLYFPHEALKVADINSRKYEECWNICGTLCDESNADEYGMNEKFIRTRAQQLDELLVCQNDTNDKVLPLVQLFANLTIFDNRKELIGEVLISSLLKILRMQLEKPEQRQRTPYNPETCVARSKQAASRALWNLAFNSKNALKIEVEGGEKLLQALAKSPDEEVKCNINGVTFMKSLQTHRDRLQTSGVMISYHTSDQPSVKALAESLARKGIKVWVEYEQGDNSAEAIAEAIRSSSVFLMCFSHRYKDSPACRLQLQLHKHFGSKFIAVKLQQGYVPHGWLATAIGGRKTYDFTTEIDMEAKLKNLAKDIRTMERGEDYQDNHTQWTKEELSEWTESMGIRKHLDMLVDHKINVVPILEFKSLIESDWVHGVESIGESLNVDRFGDLLEIAAAVRKFKGK